jgi:hypothetical protein
LGFDSWQEHNVETGCGAQEAPYTMVPVAISLRVKWQERETDHSHPSNAGVRIVFMVWYLIN